MKVGKLIEILQKEDKGAIVILTSDEGKVFHTAGAVDSLDLDEDCFREDVRGLDDSSITSAVCIWA